ncbi:hypothetical protein N4R57_14325 [Rhodobacteraceae bacterium D3-12]|nr:hypothetical protein N4R57_14325 [Rhodobacteraceae bacterium D3-12]
MKKDWILDVLADLKTFAQNNGLASLAIQLEETALVATAEIASSGEGQLIDAKSESKQFERNLGRLGTRH